MAEELLLWQNKHYIQYNGNTVIAVRHKIQFQLLTVYKLTFFQMVQSLYRHQEKFKHT